MQNARAEQRSAPSVGNAVAYFLIMYLIYKGIVPEETRTEAALMAGAIVSHLMMELRGIVSFIGGLIKK